MEKKKVLFVLCLCLFGIIFIIYIVNKKSNDLNKQEDFSHIDLGKRTKQNVSKKLKKEKEFDGLILQNAGIIYSNQIFTFSVTLINKSDTTYDTKTVLLKLLDDKNKIIDTLDVTIPSIPSKEITTLNVTTKKDIIDAHDYTFAKGK